MWIVATQLRGLLRLVPHSLPSPTHPSNFSPSSSLPPGAWPLDLSLSKAGTPPAGLAFLTCPQPDCAVLGEVPGVSRPQPQKQMPRGCSRS